MGEIGLVDEHAGLPTVAIVGRPNVGKSTLINRIIGRREAIVEERPGVTRDRKVLRAEWVGVPFAVIDTGGWILRGSSLDDKVSSQSEQAWQEADVVLFVVDVTIGITDEDREVANRLQARTGPVMVIANKVDGPTRENDIWEFVKLGLGDPWAISALHGRQTGDLLDEVVKLLPNASAGADADRERLERLERGEAGDVAALPEVPSVAIVGRPNVGKSTLFNRLIGEERAVVHDMPGTTRDTVDTVVQTDEGPIRFVDTAGMRRKAKITEGTEYYSLVRALQAIDTVDVAVLVLDAEAREDVLFQVRDRLHFMAESPVLKGSAISGKGIQKILPALGEAVESYHRRVPTRELNQVIQAAQAAHPSPAGRVLYATQGASEPPTFTLFANRDIPPTYLRYLERKIREHFSFGNTPLKIRVRRRDS